MKKNICSFSLIGMLLFSNNMLPAAIGGGGGTETNQKVIASFDVQSIRVSKDGLLSWTASNERGSLPYYVEQFIFNKWVTVAEVDGVGSSIPNSYSVPVVLNTGENTFRLRQKGYDKISRFSSPISYYSKKKAVNYGLINSNQAIEFTDDTYYVIYNPYGVIVKQGFGNSVDISNFSKGYYCLVYDNKLGGFEKKRVVFKDTPIAMVMNTPNFVKRYMKKRAIRNPYSRFKID